MKKKIYIAISLGCIGVFSLISCSPSAEELKFQSLSAKLSNIEQTLFSLEKKPEKEQLVRKNWYNPYDFKEINALYKDSDLIGKSPLISRDYYPYLEFLFVESFYKNVGSKFSYATFYHESFVDEVKYDFDNGRVAYDNEHNYQASYDVNSYIFYLYDNDNNYSMVSVVGGNIVSYSTIKGEFTRGSEVIKTYVETATVIRYYDLKEEVSYNFSVVSKVDNYLNSYEEHRYSYNYDYVEVTDSNIGEWRKYNFQSDVELSFTEYYDEFKKTEVSLYPSETKYYTNGKCYEIKELTDEKSEIFIKNMYSYQMQHYLFFHPQIDKEVIETDLFSKTYKEIIG